MTPQEIQDRMEVCQWRERTTGNPYVCTRYFCTLFFVMVLVRG